MSEGHPAEDSQDDLKKKMERAAKADEPQPAELIDATKQESEQKGYLDGHRDKYFELKNKNFEQDIEVRRDYAEKIYKLAVFWLGAVILILLLNGTQLEAPLSDGVLLALIGSTTVNVLGLLYIIVNYLYPKR
jgi:flagellar biosynthesis/type III secretory pathway protein FliH